MLDKFATDNPVTMYVIAICLPLVLIILGVLGVMLKCHRAWVRSAIASTTKPMPQWDKDQPWRDPTNIRFIENLKAELFRLEKFLSDAREAAASFVRRREELGADPVTLKMMWFALMDSSRQMLAGNDYKNGLELCTRINRIWAGNAHLEIQDCQEHIQKLKRRRQDYSTAEQKAEARSIDEQIIEKERALRDLEEVVKRAAIRAEEAAKRAQASPHQVKYDESQRIRELDIQDEIQETLATPELTKMEAARVRDGLKKKYRDNPHLTEDEKRRYIEGLDRKYAELFGKDPTTDNVISIYKKEG